MDGPPAKRARRTDSAAMWEKSESSPKPDEPRAKSSHHHSSKPDSREHRHRSRSRERRSRRRDHDKDDNPKHTNDMPPSTKNHRDDRDRDRDRERDRDRKPRERSASRDRHKRRRADNDRRRSRSPHSPPRGPRGHRNRSRSRERYHKPANGVERGRAAPSEQEPSKTTAKAEKLKENGEKMDVDGVANGVEEDDEEAQMRAVMGFVAFRSTKNTKVPGNDKLYGVRKEKKAEYRQYMNRVGGFNRPLSPSAE